MLVLITGTSSGIGKATAQKFLEMGHIVYGLDIKPSTISSVRYFHTIIDLKDADKLPKFEFGFDIIINNAGLQDSDNDIANNLMTAYNVTEKYAFQPNIKSVLFNASASAHTGFEFPLYSASKAGMIGYMKNVAWRLAKSYRATCNSISCGGVITDLNTPVLTDKALMEQIMSVTPLKRWATADEIAEWIYFLTVVNKNCSGQDILIDAGEKDLRCSFVWPGFND